jgi:hypothetical protein
LEAPLVRRFLETWIPAFAGMTRFFQGFEGLQGSF